jgi:hypothetical protein
VLIPFLTSLTLSTTISPQCRVFDFCWLTMPEFTPQNERIDKAFLLRLANVDRARFADLVKRHSAAAVTARLQQQ